MTHVAGEHFLLHLEGKLAHPKIILYFILTDTFHLCIFFLLAIPSLRSKTHSSFHRSEQNEACNQVDLHLCLGTGDEIARARKLTNTIMRINDNCSSLATNQKYSSVLTTII